MRFTLLISAITPVQLGPCFLSSAGDRSQAGSADRQDSDGEDSDGPDEEENDEEEEEDSQAESGLSTNPSVSASPQHVPSKEAEIPPSALLAQMSISSVSLPPSQPPPHTLDAQTVLMMSPVALSKQMSISGSCSLAMPFPSSPPPVTTTSDCCVSDTESVHMMSPVSPCRQMSIDYPDCDVPPSPPVPGRSFKLGQVRPMYSRCVCPRHPLPAPLVSHPYSNFESCMQETSTKFP